MPATFGGSCVGKTGFCGHRSDRPVRRVRRRCAQCPLDYLSNLVVVDGSRATRASFVKQPITAILQESAAPLANGVFADVEFGSYGLAWQAIRTPRIARHRSDSDRATR
jgi:hypothetical protein